MLASRIRALAVLSSFIGIVVLVLSFSIPTQFVHADDATSTDSSVVSNSADTTNASSTDPIATTTSSTLTSTSEIATSTESIATSTENASTTTLTSTNTADASTTASTTTSTVHVLIRDGSTIAFNGTVTLPSTPGSIDILPSITLPTASSSTIPVSNQSVLGVLYTLEQNSPTFSLSDLEYYSDYSEFYLYCVTVPAASSSPACANWQYEVDGNYPYQSIDQYQLQNGDTVNLYFGSPREVFLASSTVSAGESFVATAKSYDAVTNTYQPLTGYTIGVTQPNPSDPWSPTEIATSSVDVNGQATFSLTTPGAYGAGLEEDYYSTLTPLTVTDASSTTNAASSDQNTSSTTSSSSSSSSSVSSGGGGGSFSNAGNTTSAFAYLVSQQNPNGSLVNDQITDWAALAFALPDAPSSARSRLASYLASANPSLSSPTDYERHAMARMALGQNPYTGTDDITPIIKAFTGSYIGDPSLINQDIFALIVLPHAGFTSQDAIIQKTAAYVISQQGGDGSWYSSIDLTAAGIQALAPLGSLPGVSSAISRAESYLHSSEQHDGSFGDSFSTSWVLGALAATGQSPSAWEVGTSTPLAALAAIQQSDGGIDPTTESTTNRVWATVYALPALEGRSWSSLLSSFPLSAATAALGSGATATSTATSTPLSATSTPPSLTATSTLPVLPVVGTSTTPHLTLPLHFYSVAVAHMHHSKNGITHAPSTSTATSSSSANLASVGSAPAAHSFMESITAFFHSLGALLSHIF